MSEKESRNMVSDMLHDVETMKQSTDSPLALWVFGYGSLCWHPGFEYKRSLNGHIKGFSRRFWQGNTTHRGTEDNPGRVATLIEDTNAVTWGRAFEFVGDAALPYLQQRECRLGGYVVHKALFHPTGTEPSIPALIYVAIPGNRHWLGEATLESIAHQVVNTSGASGHNAEYVLRLARFMREHIPGARDDHLFALERIVRRHAAALKMCLVRLGGDPEPQEAAAANTSDNYQFSKRLPEKKLRCLNM